MYDSLSDSIINLPIISNNGFYLSFDHKIDADTNHAGGYLEFNLDNDSTYYYYNGNLYSTWNMTIDLENNYQFFPYFYTDLGHKISSNDIDVVNINITESYFNSSNLSYRDTIAIYNNAKGFTGTYNTWNSFELFLFFIKPVKINDIKDTLNFKFHFISDSLSNNKNGWAIKNIYSGECYETGGLANNSLKNKITTYPNPTTDAFRVDIPNEAYKTIDVEFYNLLGEKIKVEKNNGSSLNIQLINQPKGTYIVKYKIDNKYIGYSRVTKL
jgi:hypothetical protein